MPKKIFMSTDSADLANFSYKGVYVSLTIDTRKWTVTQRDEAGRPAEHDQTQELPIVLRVTKESKRLYLPIGEKYTWNNWLEMCKHEQSTRVRADSEKRANLKQHLAKIKPTICEMADAGTFSLVRLKNVYNGVADDNVTIYSIWDEYIQKKKDDGKAGTARVGRDIRNRFIKDNGMDVVFADIDHSFIQKWATKMKKAGLSTTYTGIVLRSFRTIVNIAINTDLPMTLSAIEENLNDIAGVRVICSFPEDIYLLADALLRQDDITLIERKDYIQNPKPNGYRSLHLIVEVPIFLRNETKRMRVEVQLRTIAMDFWASLEHKLRYKKGLEDSEDYQEISRQLKNCAEISAMLDRLMENIRGQIEGGRAL